MLILVGAWRLLRDATNVLMEGAPEGIDIAALERLARETPGVRDVHDMHVWSWSGTRRDHGARRDGPGAHGVEVARDIGRRIEEKVGRAHVTVQPEAASPGDHLVPTHSLTRPRG